MISFQLVNEVKRNDLIALIKQQGPWARITDNTWCIKADNKTTAEIRDVLGPGIQIQKDERLMVVDITKSAWASYYLPKEVADWLKG
jgi:hypothetical protein